MGKKRNGEPPPAVPETGPPAPSTNEELLTVVASIRKDSTPKDKETIRVAGAELLKRPDARAFLEERLAHPEKGGVSAVKYLLKQLLKKTQTPQVPVVVILEGETEAELKAMSNMDLLRLILSKVLGERRKRAADILRQRPDVEAFLNGSFEDEHLGQAAHRLLGVLREKKLEDALQEIVKQGVEGVRAFCLKLLDPTTREEAEKILRFLVVKYQKIPPVILTMWLVERNWGLVRIFDEIFLGKDLKPIVVPIVAARVRQSLETLRKEGGGQAEKEEKKGPGA